MKKENLFVLLGLMFLLALAGSANASIAGPECEVLEKPQNFEVDCSPHNLTLSYTDEKGNDLIYQIEVIDAPYSKESEEFIDFQESVNDSFENVRNQGLTTHVVLLRGIGNYSFKINKEYVIRIDYDSEYADKMASEHLLSAQVDLITNIGTWFGIIIAVGGSLAYFLKKENKSLSKKVAVAGALLFAIMLIVNILNQIVGI